MRLEDIERLEKLFVRDNMYHVPRTRDDLADALYDAADELIAAAFSAASERARADKAEAELAEERAANVALKDLCIAAGEVYKGGGVFPIKGAMALRLLKAGALARAVKGEG